jgi:hypothetical protein
LRVARCDCWQIGGLWPTTKLTFTDPEKIRELARGGLGRLREPADAGGSYRARARRGLLAADSRAVSSAEAILAYEWKYESSEL